MTCGLPRQMRLPRRARQARQSGAVRRVGYAARLVDRQQASQRGLGASLTRYRCGAR
jgi:hypothetical protein